MKNKIKHSLYKVFPKIKIELANKDYKIEQMVSDIPIILNNSQLLTFYLFLMLFSHAIAESNKLSPCQNDICHSEDTANEPATNKPESELFLDKILELAKHTYQETPVRNCNKKNSDIVSAIENGETIFISTDANKRIDCNQELQKVRELRDEKSVAIINDIVTSNSDLRKTCPLTDEFYVYVNTYAHMLNTKQIFEKAKIANCNDQAQLFISTLMTTKDPIVKKWKKGQLSLIHKIDQAENHLVSIVFRENTLIPNREFTSENIKTLAREYPAAVMVDLWNHMIIPIRFFLDHHQSNLKKIIRKNLKEFIPNPNAANLSNNHIDNITRFYTNFGTCRIEMAANEPNNKDCVDKVNKVIHKRVRSSR